ncbi:MAG: hypothetical protein FJ206_10480 [Gemmatimonadetes bacterium]|nr:hypothetical protein [Gemmatimonadota bacterium]
MTCPAIATETLISHRCAACGVPHRIRAAVVTETEAPGATAVGFFARCPETGLKAWLVVEVPAAEDGTRVVAFGPPDDDTWEPRDPDELEHAWRAAPELPAAAPLLSYPPRGVRHGGFRHAAGTLRQALGCPFHP